jgi:HD-GYP domain-containing protein (c-di-GMP phosphodiesterase class II)
VPASDSPQPGEPHVRLAELIAALSLATNLGTAQPLEHAMSTCILAMRLSEALGLPEAERREIYYVALLRMIGCTAEAHVVAAVLGDELAARAWLARAETGNPASVLGALIRHLGEGNPPLRRARMVATALAGLPRLVATGAAHCEVAQLLAGRLGFGEKIQTALGQVFERWNGRGVPNGLRHDQIVRSVRVVQLTQDAVVAQRIGGVEAAIATARQRAGSAYDPQLVEPFCREAYQLFSDESRGSTWDAVLAIEPGAHAHPSSGQLDDALTAVADFVDLKSPVLSGHSRGVAELAAAAAKACRRPPADAISAPA